MSIVFAVSATKSLESSNSRLSCSRRSLPPRAGPHWVRPHRADQCHSGHAVLQPTITAIHGRIHQRGILYPNIWNSGSVNLCLHQSSCEIEAAAHQDPTGSISATQGRTPLGQATPGRSVPLRAGWVSAVDHCHPGQDRTGETIIIPPVGIMTLRQWRFMERSSCGIQSTPVEILSKGPPVGSSRLHIDHRSICGKASPPVGSGCQGI